VIAVNVAVTFVLAVIVTTHAAVPVHPLPLQPAKVEVRLGVAVSVTTVPVTKLVEQRPAGQLMPAGVLVTFPLPVPVRLTVSARVIAVNVAVTFVLAVIVTTHKPVPEHPLPLQPAKVEVRLGVAASVTVVPVTKLVEQRPAGQLMPAGVLVTLPVPAPVRLTVSARVIAVNVAVTLALAVMVTTHKPVPEHPLPLQPAKVEVRPGVAVSVTTVPWVNVLPGGVFEVVPEPFPAVATVKVYVLRVNVAVTRASAVMFTLHEPVPEHPLPLQPAKVEETVGVALSVTNMP
jgi:hypothetical protein